MALRTLPTENILLLFLIWPSWRTHSKCRGLFFHLINSNSSDTAGLLWTSGQPDEETSTWQQYSQETSMPLVGFEPAIPARERPPASTLFTIPRSISRGLALFSTIQNICYTTDTRQVILSCVLETRQEAALGILLFACVCNVGILNWVTQFPTFSSGVQKILFIFHINIEYPWRKQKCNE
jgi:hypothetical protein